tara:strand:- start:5899 stop:7842 length:1944 start_codon:yes stop_codon:yes gene_type:complete
LKNKVIIKKEANKLESMKVVDLKALAKKLKVSNFSKLKKAELINLLSNNFSDKNIIKKDKEKKIHKKELKNDQSSSELLIILGEKIIDANWRSNRLVIEEIISKLESKYFKNLNSIKTSNKTNEIDLDKISKEKKDFYDLKNEYRRKKRKYFKEIDENKRKNGEIKKDIIDNIKLLIGAEESINTIYKKFKDLQNKWHETGPAQRKDNNNLWQTYKHHVERFYDFLHINRELRNIDFKHNYDAKIKIIEKAEFLSKSPDVLKAGKELNTLHLLWKNDLGPVASEHREILWKRFQKASKIIHSRRQNFQKNIDEIQLENLKLKDSIISKMVSLYKNIPSNHYEWQKSIKNFNELRDEFKKIGSINKNESKKSWGSFREVGKEFNRLKNNFYKDQKLNQNKNIEKYKLLIDEVEKINAKDDWKDYLNRMKSIQNEFNKIGFVPIKISKSLKKEFVNKTNFYFKRLKNGLEERNQKERSIVNEKIDSINLINLKKNQFTEEPFNFFSNIWTEIISEDDLSINSKNKLTKIFIKKILSLDKNKQLNENTIFDIEANCIKDDLSELQNRITHYKKDREIITAEINQLENNLDFFTKSSNQSPILKDVTDKLNNLNNKSYLVKYKIDKLNSLIKSKLPKNKLNDTSEKEPVSK